MKLRSVVSLSLVAVLALACGGEPAEEDRDLTLPSAEAVTAMNDAPDSTEADPVTEAPAAPAPTPSAPTPRAATPRAPTPPPAPPTVAAGNGFLAFASDTLTSRNNNVGDPTTATLGEDLVDNRGRVMVPAGAVLSGTITELAPAENPGGEGTMVITYTQVTFDGHVYDIALATDSMGTYMKGRGVTAGDAAKVGAGAVAGAIAGRLLGGNRTGTAVGAAAGAAAGAGIAAATRDIDIILDAGAAIFLTITDDFQLTSGS